VTAEQGWGLQMDMPQGTRKLTGFFFTDKKAREAMASQAKGKGPMNTGQQGIKKSGKK
jgi:hypothetical protein